MENNKVIKPGDVLLFKVGDSELHPFGQGSRVVIGVAVTGVNCSDTLPTYGRSFKFLTPSEIYISNDKKTWWPRAYCNFENTQYIARENYVHANLGQITDTKVQAMLTQLHNNLEMEIE